MLHTSKFIHTCGKEIDLECRISIGRISGKTSSHLF